MTKPSAPINPAELDPTAVMSGPAEAERRAQQTMEENALRDQLQMSHDHDAALMENQRRDMEDREERYKQAMENRITHDDVQELNDQAELEVYGSRGRTYVDPNTGDVIADKDNPKKGILDEMREEPQSMLGRSQEERDKAAKQREEKAKKYEEDLLGLVNDGFELSQAKLIMDLREKDKPAEAHLAKSLEADGMDHDLAVETAKWKYVDKDAKRLEIIKKEGAFTEEEYAHARRGNELYRGPVTYKDLKKPKNPNQSPPAERHAEDFSRDVFYIKTPDDAIKEVEYKRDQASDPKEKLALEKKINQMRVQKAQIDPAFLKQIEKHNREGLDLLQDLGNALNRYASLQAKFEKQVTSKGRKQLEEARREYETLRQEANDRTSKFLQDQGFSNAEITEELLGQDAGEYDARGNELERGEAGLVRDVTRQEMERQGKESKFITWWAKQKGAKGFLAKAGVMAPVGIAAGVAAGPLIGAGAGAALLGLGAKRLATGMIRNRTDNAARLTEAASLKTNQRHAAQRRRMGNTQAMLKHAKDNDKIHAIGDVTSAHLDDAIDSNKSNMKRAGVSMGVGLALGGLAGAAADGLIDRDISLPFIGDGDHGGHNGADHGNGNHAAPGAHEGGKDAIPNKPTGNDFDKDLASSTSGNHAQGGHLNVAPGSGFEDSLQNQYGLSDAQAHRAYEAMRSDLLGAKGTYQISPGNIGVSSPGDFNVPAAAQHDLDNYLRSIKSK